MFPATKRWLTVPFVVALALLSVGPVHAQSTRRQQRLSALQQQNALQIAVQQTTALMQVSFGQNSALSQTALSQLNVLQTALQQTQTLQGALSMQHGQLTAFQMNLLSQEQTSLMGLLATQAPPPPSRTSRK